MAGSAAASRAVQRGSRRPHGPHAAPVRPGQSLPLAARASEVYLDSPSTATASTLELLSRILVSLDGSRGRKAVLLVSGGFVYDTDARRVQAGPVKRPGAPTS